MIRKNRIVFFFLVLLLVGLILNYLPAIADYIMVHCFDIKKSLWIKSVLSDLKAGKYEKYLKIPMKDNSWIVFAMSHDCCSGEGFNCVISKDSTGKIMIDKGKNFCGVEDMGNQFSKIGSNSCSVFYEGVQKIGLNLEEVK